MKNTKRLFAMKTMKKQKVITRFDEVSFRQERDVLIFGDHQWIPKLHYTFQDDENLVKHRFRLSFFLNINSSIKLK